ncbi:hypothetical protein D3C78_1543350 [compost metagenome]
MQIIHPTRRQFFQQVHRVVEADAWHFHLFRGEAVANDEGVIRVLTHHFVGDVQHRQREFGAVVATAAPLIIALVGVRGVELLD